jgi:hypothetical protein
MFRFLLQAPLITTDNTHVPKKQEIMKYRRRPQKQPPEKKDAFFSKAPDQRQPDTDQVFFQPKLEIDPADSPAEKEADAVASEVVNRPRHQGAEGLSVQKKKIRRMAEEEEPAAKRIQKQEEEEAAQTKRLQKQEEEEEEMQPKRIQKQEEEEAQARRIQKQEEEEEAAQPKRIQKQEEEEAQAKRIQKQEEEEAAQAMLIQRQEIQNHSETGIQRKGAKKKGQGSQVELEKMIQQSKGQGMALPEDVRSEMEAEFGADFSSVSIHTGPLAVKMTQMLQAHAFTHGHDIYFNEGRFNPKSPKGRELLAHELTHVVQQKGNGK